MADAAASKAAEATHVGSTPTFPTNPSIKMGFFSALRPLYRLYTRHITLLCLSNGWLSGKSKIEALDSRAIQRLAVVQVDVSRRLDIMVSITTAVL